MSVTLRILRLPHGEGLPLPAYQSDHAAGFDLDASYSLTTIVGGANWVRWVSWDHIYYTLRSVLESYSGTVDQTWTITGTADAAVQAQPAGAVTVTVAEPPSGPREWLAGAMA